MSVEIERKFLVNFDIFKNFIRSCEKMTLCKQGYLNNAKDDLTFRVRIYGEIGYLTIKTKSVNGISCNEYEYEIPYNDAKELLEQCKNNIINKYRYIYMLEGKKWEIDYFLNENNGLVVAEIELFDENEIFQKPLFVTDEVTFDKRYTNLNLSRKPFSSW